MPYIDTPPSAENVRGSFMHREFALLSSYFRHVKAPASHEIRYIRSRYRKEEIETALYEGIDDATERQKYKRRHFHSSHSSLLSTITNFFL